MKEIKVSTGIFYRKHSKRKYGIKFDQYWILKHTVDGKQIKEGLGYTSEGMSQTRAQGIRAEIQENKKLNKTKAGKNIQRLPESFREMNDILAEEKREEQLALIADEKINEPFNIFFERFVSDRENAGRPHDEILKYRSRYEKWIKPIFGKKPPQKIVLFDLQRMVKNMNGKAAPSTIVKVVGFLSLAYKHNARHHKYSGGNPVIRKEVFENNTDIIKHENYRERYLSIEEVNLLLDALPEQTSTMALLSLHCGFRAGELFKMKWADINFKTSMISIRDTKSSKARSVMMSKAVNNRIKPLQGRNNEYLFLKERSKKRLTEIPRNFKRTIDALGLNTDIEDRRQKVVFHTLRHTCGSWLVNEGIDLFTVQKVLGHKHISTTERYVHSEGQLDRAASVMDNIGIDQGAQTNG